jgi:RNA polymerase sigma-32 factor
MTHTAIRTPARDDLARYLEQTRRFPMLGPEEERALFERWRENGDQEAKERLLGSHLRLVVKIARGFQGYGFPLADLIAEGNVGLVRALAKFDPDRGARLATYATWWIRAEISDYVMHNWSLVKLGTTSSQKRLFFNLRRAKSRLNELGAGDLSDEAVARIAKQLGVSEQEVVEMNRRLAGSEASLSAPVSEDSEQVWQDTLVAEESDQETRLAETSELAWRREQLAQALDVLTERERHILSERRLRDDPLTLQDLALVYGVSRERVRQIEARALEKLQQAVATATAGQHRAQPRLAA